MSLQRISDIWTPPESYEFWKNTALHLALGLTIGFGVAWFSEWWIGALVAFVLGVVNEVRQYFDGRNLNLLDRGFDVLGWLLGGVAGGLIAAAVS